MNALKGAMVLIGIIATVAMLETIWPDVAGQMLLSAMAGAYLTYLVCEKKNEREHVDHNQRPGTATVAQMGEIFRLGEEMSWNVPSRSALEEWSWSEAQQRLFNMRGKKIQIETYEKQLLNGGVRNLPQEMVLGVRWDDSQRRLVSTRIQTGPPNDG